MSVLCSRSLGCKILPGSPLKKDFIFNCTHISLKYMVWLSKHKFRLYEGQKKAFDRAL